MRIGIDVRLINPPSPGQQRYLWRLGAWLGDRGHEIHLLNVRHDDPRSGPDPQGYGSGDCLHVHRLHALSRTDLRAHVTALELDVLLLNPERSRRYRGLRPNLLRSAYGTDHYAQRLRSFRHPVAHSVQRLARETPWSRAEQRWERAFYGDGVHRPRVIAQSEYMREQIVSSYPVPEEDVHVIPNGVDLSEFSSESRLERRERARARWGIPADAPCLVLMAHNFRLKGLPRLVQALRQPTGTDRPWLLVAGSGTGRRQRRNARRWVHGAGLEDRIVFAGSVASPIDAYAAADVLVHPSWHDSFGFAVLEAMACGLPVVTTPWVGASELIESGSEELIVDPGNTIDLARAIRSALGPDGKRWGRAAAATAKRYGERDNFTAVEGVMRLAADR
ncbi:MAG: glycosyltransferase family 4 protein [Gemmatimonadota bacterium]